MTIETHKSEARNRRHARVRKKIWGTQERPRLNVYRSLNHIYAQLINDDSNCTIISASTLDLELRDKLDVTRNREAAHEVGVLLAKRARNKGIDQVVFDRGGYLYHGRVQALAEGARSQGLAF